MKAQQKTRNTCVECGKRIDPRSKRCISCSKMGNRFGRFNKGNKRNDFSGSGNPRWNGGRGITSQGYVEIICPNGFSPNSRGRILEHRYVMSKHLGRNLLRTEIVHHINGDKEDNRIENLELLSSQCEHMSKHRPSRETRNKISDSMKGRTFSEKHRENLRVAALNRYAIRTTL